MSVGPVGDHPGRPRTPPRVVSQRRDSVAPPGVGPSLAPPLAHRVGGQMARTLLRVAGSPGRRHPQYSRSSYGGEG
jgi:hypothetical protein